ncbi:NYN domain-containing protein [Actinorhabdospora filicis]|uniref:NYN domain-containing protein n=1 Tax=Actinorhabdospora filicis TaxID=1785913 RepID=A0A9W6SSB9_9ACTN|nr:NYN domain-containing protein [Actinorhabdospora filicis]GLZ81060.1 NYN domain-containing protein [Actinorhabdospora filicis]
MIDVGYLYAAAAEVLLGATSRREYKVDAEKLIGTLIARAAERLTDGELLRVYWFDAARDRVPTVDQRVIAQMDYVKVRLGNLNSRGQQKGVDAMIRADLEQLARHRAITEAILLAGDEDMVPAVEIAQAYGVRLHLWGVEPPYGTNQAERLVWEADTVEILPADFCRSYFTKVGTAAAGTAKVAAASQPAPVVIGPPSPASVFGQRHSVAVTMSAADAWDTLERAKPKPTTKEAADRNAIEETGEYVAHKWILTRGRDNIQDLLPGPTLPTVIDKELLVEAEKTLGYSLRDLPEARIWVRDGFWDRVYREFDHDGKPW